MAKKSTIPFEERFRRFIAQGTPDDCWNWTGRKNPKGYGHFYKSGIHISAVAHRIAYEFAAGPVPKGLFVLHRCDNRACCNPDHLFLGTPRDNTNDMLAKNRQARGERHSQAKLSQAQALRIINSAEPAKELAAEFGVGITAIQRIRAGVRWGWLRSAA